MASRNRIAARERRVVVAGASIVTVAFLVTFAVVPFMRHWIAREAQLGAARERVTYFETLARNTGALEQSAADAERVLSEQSRRVIHARSASLASSMVQSLLQSVADANRMLVTRVVTTDNRVVDVAGSPTGGGVDVSAAGFDVPATFAAYGDIVGALGFLDVLHTGPRIFFIDRMVMQRNAALLGAPDVVQLSVSLRAPVLPE